MSFKAETKKLLDIVTHSIYTDKEIFVRELMSNCSDALEKQRYKELTGDSQGGTDLNIEIITNEKERTLTIFDSGVGMSREEAINNLGTIAKSGSQEFVNALKEGDNNPDTIIGQFGVGFYSSFIVSDIVEVYTKQDSNEKGVRWVSDGSGEFQIDDVDNIGFDRGTKIILKLKADCRQFSKELEIEKILKKYSLFITHPIRLNGSTINALQAIWYREKREVTEDEYERFFEHLADTKVPYKYKLHYSTDVPLAIKSIIYIPSNHNERMGMSQEEPCVHLYCRKVLIKEKCREVVAPYLRFVKGVVDCEDLPLNISRETYQDSNLISKLKTVVTKRILKMLEDELKKDEDKFNKWYDDFQHFLKEGLTMDGDNRDAILKLLRFKSTFNKNYVSLDDYVKNMKDSQKKIYFVVTQSMKTLDANPFMEIFKGTDIPILVLHNNVDEICFQQLGEYKGHKLVNIETSYEEISADLKSIGVEHKEVKEGTPAVPEDDISTFSLWLKTELEPTVSKVNISKRIKKVPAVIYGQMSSSMRMMMQMMDQSQQEQMMKNNTLEINIHHPVMIELNQMRKKDKSQAADIAKMILDNAMLSSGLPFDISQCYDRSTQLIEKFLKLENKELGENVSKIETEHK